ncbi:hypothetical protein ACP70R_002110 [Stipagrostis hirtigluma subsp. patula]
MARIKPRRAFPPTPAPRAARVAAVASFPSSPILVRAARRRHLLLLLSSSSIPHLAEISIFLPFLIPSPFDPIRRRPSAFLGCGTRAAPYARRALPPRIHTVAPPSSAWLCSSIRARRQAALPTAGSRPRRSSAPSGSRVLPGWLAASHCTRAPMSPPNHALEFPWRCSSLAVGLRCFQDPPYIGNICAAQCRRTQHGCVHQFFRFLQRVKRGLLRMHFEQSVIQLVFQNFEAFVDPPKIYVQTNIPAIAISDERVMDFMDLRVHQSQVYDQERDCNLHGAIAILADQRMT